MQIDTADNFLSDSYYVKYAGMDSFHRDSQIYVPCHHEQEVQLRT